MDARRRTTGLRRRRRSTSPCCASPHRRRTPEGASRGFAFGAAHQVWERLHGRCASRKADAIPAGAFATPHSRTPPANADSGCSASPGRRGAYPGPGSPSPRGRKATLPPGPGERPHMVPATRARGPEKRRGRRQEGREPFSAPRARAGGRGDPGPRPVRGQESMAGSQWPGVKVRESMAVSKGPGVKGRESMAGGKWPGVQGRE